MIVDACAEPSPPTPAAAVFAPQAARQHVLHDDPLAAIDKLTGRIQVPIRVTVPSSREA